MTTSSAPLTLIIADDEPLARQALLRPLAHRSDVTVVALCGTTEDTIAECLRHRPDAILLDVQMGRASGFDVLAALPRDYKPTVIFVTAFEQYAVSAFEAQALDYVLKPVTAERINAAVARARVRRDERALAARADGPADETMNSSLQEFLVRVGPRQFPISVEEIDWIEADSCYARLHVAERSHLVRIALNVLEQRLPVGQFIRVHRSAIVNISRVRELRSDFRGHVIVVGAMEIPVSRARWPAFDTAFRRRRATSSNVAHD